MMEKAMQFEHHTFGERLKSMLKVDFTRMFTQPLVYIMLGVCLVMPVLILIMTSMMSGTTVDPVTGEETVMETFTNVWQAIGSVSGESSGMSMDLTTMCNINLIYFFAAILVCLFVADDFRSGYAKNLFTVRSKKSDYVVSKTLVCFACCAGMMLCYFAGAMIGGAIAGLPFDLGSATAGGIVLCMLAKIFLLGVFVAIDLLVSVAAKQRLWMSIVGSFAVGMLLFMMIPTMTPLDSTFLNVILCLAGGALFGAGLGAVSNVVLKKTSLV